MAYGLLIKNSEKYYKKVDKNMTYEETTRVVMKYYKENEALFLRRGDISQAKKQKKNIIYDLCSFPYS